MFHFGRFARMRRMKRRTWLRAAPLWVLLPAGIAEAMERAFLQARDESPSAEGKRQGDAMAESSKVYELRIYHAAREKQHVLLHSGASEPRGGGRELESFPGRSGMEGRESQVRREWPTGGEN